MSRFCFLPPECEYPLPQNFDFQDYIETEREMWAFFPETEGKRVNFCQLGLTAKVFIESRAVGDLSPEETYFLMSCEDLVLRAIRMKAIRWLTLEEFRMSQLTANRLIEKLHGTVAVMEQVQLEILGREVMEDSDL